MQNLLRKVLMVALTGLPAIWLHAESAGKTEVTALEERMNNSTREFEREISRSKGGRNPTLISEFNREAESLWTHVATLIGRTPSRSYLSTVESELLFVHYLGWFSDNAAKLFTLDLSFTENQRLLMRFIEIRQTPLYIFEEKTLAVLAEYRRRLLEVYQSRNVKHQQQIVEAILGNQTANLPLIKLALEHSAQTLIQAKDFADTLPPEAYWLVGLGELVMEGENLLLKSMTSEQLSSYVHALLNSQSAVEPAGFKLETLLPIYLEMYQAAFDRYGVSKDRMARPKRGLHYRSWISSLIIAPVKHISTLKDIAPRASAQAEDMLVGFANRTRSKMLRHDIQNYLNVVRPGAWQKCKLLVRRLRGD